MKVFMHYEIVEVDAKDFSIFHLVEAGPAVGKRFMAKCQTQEDATLIRDALEAFTKSSDKPVDGWHCVFCSTKHNARPDRCTYCGTKPEAK